MKKTILLGVSSVVLGVSALSNTALAQNINQVRIENFAYGGEGCPQGSSVNPQISATRPGGLVDVLTLSLPEFTVAQGTNVSISERRKNCNVAINLRIPQGYSFSISRAQYAGAANIPLNVSGVHRLIYSFPFSDTATFETVLNGVFQSRYYFRTSTLQPSALVWSPCSQLAALNLRTSLALQGNPESNASLGIRQVTKTATQTVTERYNIQWRRCSLN